MLVFSEAGSTHVETFLAESAASLVKCGFAAPTHSDGRFYTIQDMNSLSKNFYNDIHISKKDKNGEFGKYLRRTAEQGQNIIISETDFDMLDSSEIAFVKDLLDANGFKDVTIVIVYREVLSRLVSNYNDIRHNFIDVGSMSTFLMARLPHEESEWDGYVTKWGHHFGRESIRLVDYHGVQAQGKDEAYVIVCEVAGLLCEEVAGLNGGGAAHEHPASPAPVELFDALCLAAQAGMGCMSTPLSSKDVLYKRRMLDEAYASFKKAATRSKNKLPFRSVSVAPLALFARQIDTGFRKRHGDLMLYADVAANEAVLAGLVVEELDVLAMLGDAQLWGPWLHEEAVRLEKRGYFKQCSNARTMANPLSTHFHHFN